MMNEHEPMPIPNNRPAVWDLVLSDMQERDQMGTEKYGTRLQPHNGRNFMVDAYQESLDLAVYLRGRIEEEVDGLTFTFPRLRFVDEAGLFRQIQKIESEFREVYGAYQLPGYDRLVDETLDLMQACATLLHMIKERYGVNIARAFSVMLEKNRARGYERGDAMT